MPKADRIVYGGLFPTHSLTITGVNIDSAGFPSQFRVENSLKKEGADTGLKFLLMSRQWFEEFVFAVVIDKSIVSEEVLNVFDTDPSVLPAWDPMGKLAH